MIERIMDELANELGMEPLELRRKNWIERDEFPYTTVAGLEYDSGDYEKATARATELLGYDDLRREQQARRDRNDPVQIGIGVSTYTEMCGLAPSRWLGREGYIAGGWEAATVRVLPLGKVEAWVNQLAQQGLVDPAADPAKLSDTVQFGIEGQAVWVRIGPLQGPGL